MPHELLIYAMVVSCQHAHSRQNMQDKLDLLIAHVENVKEQVATDWVYMKGLTIPTVTRFPNDDQHPKLFP